MSFLSSLLVRRTRPSRTRSSHPSQSPPPRASRARSFLPLLALAPFAAACQGADRLAAPVSSTPAALVGEATNPVGTATDVADLWLASSQLAALPTSGAAWTNLKRTADGACGTPDLTNQDDPANVCVLAKALVFARTGGEGYRADVLRAVRSVATSGTYSGRALALGRELAAYVISADLVSLPAADPALDGQFRSKLAQLRTAYTSGGPRNLVECHEQRPNNWGTMCGASRVAVDVYLGDQADLARAATVFRGYLGDRGAYAGFKFGADLSWHCDAARPVPINPAGCTKAGHVIDGVLPDDQRRAGSFTWPAPKENYVYEALQGALTQAVLLSRQGYDVWNWSDRALLRAFTWLNVQDAYPAANDDTWQPHVINAVYGSSFAAPVPARAGKVLGWTDWTSAAR